MPEVLPSTAITTENPMTIGCGPLGYFAAPEAAPQITPQMTVATNDRGKPSGGGKYTPAFEVPARADDVEAGEVFEHYRKHSGPQDNDAGNAMGQLEQDEHPITPDDSSFVLHPVAAFLATAMTTSGEDRTSPEGAAEQYVMPAPDPGAAEHGDAATSQLPTRDVQQRHDQQRRGERPQRSELRRTVVERLKTGLAAALGGTGLGPNLAY